MGKIISNLLNTRFMPKFRQCLSDLFYQFCKTVLRWSFRLCFRVRVSGLEHCPKTGPLLVVCNHISEWDPPFFGSSLPWQVNWMAKTELFQLWGGRMQGFFRLLHCIPVDREKADPSTVKQTVKLLKGKRPVVIFAEGGVRTDETSLLGKTPQLKEGAAAMAILSGAPILPVLLNGTIQAYKGRNWLFRGQTLEVVIGPVFRLETRNRAEATDVILHRLLELKPMLKRQMVY